MVNTGLRERKKERTRATITRVALGLFARDGFAATTVTAIAEAAEISPRTVSTYFPSKELIVFAEYPAYIDHLCAYLARRPPSQSVVESLGAWMREVSQGPVSATNPLVRARTEAPDFARLRQTAIQRDPELWALERRYTRRAAGAITAAIAEELGLAPDALAARAAGEAAVATLLELNATAALRDEAAADSLDVVLSFLTAGVDAVRD